MLTVMQKNLKRLYLAQNFMKFTNFFPYIHEYIVPYVNSLVEKLKETVFRTKFYEIYELLPLHT
jgi:hypothetical protein